jgi:hypothetical protein
MVFIGGQVKNLACTLVSKLLDNRANQVIKCGYTGENLV